MSLNVTTLKGGANFPCILMRTLGFRDVKLCIPRNTESGRVRNYTLISPAPGTAWSSRNGSTRNTGVKAETAATPGCVCSS